jgi:hypothetical protein
MVPFAEDAVVRFVAPEDGTYRFDTLASFGLDTLIYLQTACGDQGSELDCNDDYGDYNNGEVQSELLIDLIAGQEVFLVVDSFGTEEGAEGAAFSAQVEKVNATAPVLNTARVAFSYETYSIGAEVSGTDPEGDVEVIGFIFELDGVAQEPLEIFISDFGELLIDGEMFSGSVAGGLGEEYAALSAVSVYVVDSFGLASEPVVVEIEAPMINALGEACDLADGFTDCATGTLCLPPEGESVGVCEEVFAPTLTDGFAAYNAEANTFGITVNGSDLTPEGADVAGFEVTFFDEAGEDILGQSIQLRLTVVIDEADPSLFSASFSGDWLDPSEMANALALVEILAYDALNLDSAPINLEVGVPVQVEAGAACDVESALNVCPVDYLCFDTCVLENEVDYSCPADWTVGELFLDAEVTGDNSASTIAGESSCGGGGPSDVYSFTAETAGTYHFIATGAEMVDMLIYARSYCSAFLPNYELACNDDYVMLNSGVEVELTEGQTIYLFIDSFRGGNAGAYSLVASSGSLPPIE